MRGIVIMNQKGGVGKTTTAVNLAAALAEAGRRVGLIDLDPQAHATLHLGADPQAGPTIYEVLSDQAPLAAAWRPVADRLWLVASSLDLAAVEVELATLPGRERVLRSKLLQDGLLAAGAASARPAEASATAASHAAHSSDDAPGLTSATRPEGLDFLLIDCPPSLGVLTLNALAALDEVFIPLQPHFLALHGLSRLLETIGRVTERINSRLRLSGVVLCMYDSSTRLAAEVSQDVGEFFQAARNGTSAWSQTRLFQSRIRRNIRLAEAPSFGQSILQYAPSSNGTEDYRQLAREVIEQGAG